MFSWDVRKNRFADGCEKESLPRWSQKCRCKYIGTQQAASMPSGGQGLDVTSLPPVAMLQYVSLQYVSLPLQASKTIMHCWRMLRFCLVGLLGHFLHACPLRTRLPDHHFMLHSTERYQYVSLSLAFMQPRYFWCIFSIEDFFSSVSDIINSTPKDSWSHPTRLQEVQ